MQDTPARNKKEKQTDTQGFVSSIKGNKATAHNIKCLNCGYSRFMKWKPDISCPLCASTRFFPVITVGKEVIKKTRRNRHKVIEFGRYLKTGILWVKNWKQSRLIGIVCIGIIAITWMALFLKTREVKFTLASGFKIFQWARFFRCKDCKNRFSLNQCIDKAIPYCPECKSTFVFPVRGHRVSK